MTLKVFYDLLDESTLEITTLSASAFASPLGPMLIIGDDKGIYLCEFEGKKNLSNEVEKLRKYKKMPIVEGVTSPIDQLKKELSCYFNGKLKTFKTPIHLTGSFFQITTWNALLNIPYGQTKSYLGQAISINKHTAFRAVANANGKNPLAIIVPCHRVIAHNGSIGGYSGGLEKKKWLLSHERRFS